MDHMASRAKPDRVNFKVLVAKLECFLERLQLEPEVLADEVNVLLLRDELLPQELEQAELRGHGPAEEVAKHDVVGEGDDVFQQPKVGLVLSVVKVLKRVSVTEKKSLREAQPRFAKLHSEVLMQLHVPL